MNSLFLDMFEEFQKHLSESISFLNGKKLLMAVSGGIDSMVMADLFSKSGFDISLAHCNFNLRGAESDEDETFVKNYADEIKAPFYSIRFDTKAFANDNKLSVQVAARRLRYAWFDELMEQHHFDFLLTAHHADD